MRSILIITLLSCFWAVYEAKVFSKCELARKLKTMGMDGYHGQSLASCECECSFCLSPKRPSSPAKQSLPFHFLIYLFVRALFHSLTALLVSASTALHSYQDLLLSLSTRDCFIYSKFSSAVPPNHLPTQWPGILPRKHPETHPTSLHLAPITFAFICILSSPVSAAQLLLPPTLSPALLSTKK